MRKVTGQGKAIRHRDTIRMPSIPGSNTLSAPLLEDMPGGKAIASKTQFSKNVRNVPE